MRLVIVTGMSGAGKTAALKMLEDMGFYCVDNLPIPLVGKFAELVQSSSGEVSCAALGNRCTQRRRAGTAGGNAE